DKPIQCTTNTNTTYLSPFSLCHSHFPSLRFSSLSAPLSFPLFRFPPALSLLGDDINLDVSSVLAVRHFCNKVWNGVRFTLNALGEEFTPLPLKELQPRSPLDRWLLDRLRRLTEECDRRLRAYESHGATAAIQAFWVQNYCDVYV
ncbi:hypothetical protein FKM82_027032, partial [Ascaphus truei]